jgi:hypothetical protein
MTPAKLREMAIERNKSAALYRVGSLKRAFHIGSEAAFREVAALLEAEQAEADKPYCASCDSHGCICDVDSSEQYLYRQPRV